MCSRSRGLSRLRSHTGENDDIHPAADEAARAILLDAEDRVLLLRYDENGGWATPGVRWRPTRTRPR